MINATRELRENLREFGDNELGCIACSALRLTLSVRFPKRDFFSIYYKNHLICSIGKNLVYLKRSERNRPWEIKEFYEKTKLTKEQVFEIERIAEKWTKKYSHLMI